jgi:MoxR-like ATPase
MARHLIRHFKFKGGDMLGERDNFLNWYRGDGVAGKSEPFDDRGAAARLIAMLDDPAGYRPTREAIDAVNVALLMNLPLLVSGEPGCGKTQLGFAVAHELGLATPAVFVTKSTSQARDLFYSYDAIRHFHASQIGKDPSAAPFIQLQPLGRAIFDALPPKQRPPFAGISSQQPPRRSVVIVDEIDKAPRDFPNDLLFELDHLRFRIPEFGNLETPPIDEALRPILFITTNSEQLLPDAFVRRCAFLRLEPPRGPALAALIEHRFRDILMAEQPLIQDIVALADRLRDHMQLDRQPSSAELLQFTAAVMNAGGDPRQGLRAQPISVRPFLQLLAKSAGDVERLVAELG